MTAFVHELYIKTTPDELWRANLAAVAAGMRAGSGRDS